MSTAAAVQQPVQQQNRYLQRRPHCGVCGQVGHNRRTCPQNRQQQNRAYRQRVDQQIRQAVQNRFNISQQQQVARRNLQQQQQVETIIEPTMAEPIDAEDCPICMEKLGKTNCCTTGCGHQYCLNCFVKHVSTKDTCPICRQKIPNIKNSSSQNDTNLQEIERLQRENRELHRQTYFILNYLDQVMPM